MTSFSLSGCATALVTPFTPDGALDEAALTSLVDWQVAEGIHGLVPCGSTGEAATLSLAERRRVVDAALARLPDHQRVPLVLFHFEDLAYDEIAHRLSVSLPKVKTDIMRGRAALARLLSADPGARETLKLPKS